MNPFGRAKLKPQITNKSSTHNDRLSAGLFGGNDQNQTSANSVESFVWNFVLVYPPEWRSRAGWYLFAIWNLLIGAYSNILINSNELPRSKLRGIKPAEIKQYVTRF